MVETSATSESLEESLELDEEEFAEKASSFWLCGCCFLKGLLVGFVVVVVLLLVFFLVVFVVDLP